MASPLSGNDSFDSPFYQAIETLEKAENIKALDIIKRGDDDFVKGQDGRTELNGGNAYIDRKFEYRYHEQPREGFTLLHYAMLYSDVEVMKYLMDNGADPLQADATGATALHYACLFGKCEAIREFLTKSEKCCEPKELVNKLNNHGWSPLFYAGEREHVDIIELLVDYADLKQVSGVKQMTALHFFSRYSSPECVKILLRKESRVCIDKQDIDGNTALHLAFKINDAITAELLLDYGADPTVLNNDEFTPLLMAMQYRAVKCVYLLLDSWKLKQEFNLSLVQKAVTLDEPGIVLRLLDMKDAVHTVVGNTMLHDIVKSEAYSEDEFTTAVRKFGKHCIEYEDADGRTPIMLAAMLNKHTKLKILLDTYLRMLEENFFYPEDDMDGINEHLYQDLIGKKDRNGDCAVHLAVQHEGPDADFEHTVKVLHELREKDVIVVSLKGIDEEARDPLLRLDKKDMTGIHVAISCGNFERALILLRVSKVSVAGLETMMKSLLTGKIKDGKQTVDVKTGSLIAAAIEAKHPDILKYLLVKGAEVSHEHFKEVVFEQENEEISMLLVRYAENAEHLVKELNGYIKDSRSELTAETEQEMETPDQFALTEISQRPEISLPMGEERSAETDQVVDQTSMAEESKSSVLFHELIKKMPQVAEEAMYRSAQIKIGTGYRHHLLESDNTSKDQNLTSTLEVLVEHKRLTLLQHPVVQEFLNSKWRKLGRPVYYVQLLLYIFFIIPLSVLVLLPTFCTEVTLGSTLFTPASLNGSVNSCYETVSYSLAAILLCIATMYLGVATSNVISLLVRKKYQQLLNLFVPVGDNLNNCIQPITLLLALIFSLLVIIDTNTGCCMAGRWHFGLFAVIFGWANLMLLISIVPIVGEHVITFVSIIWTFIKLSLFALLLILATNIVLMLIFFDSQARRSPFYSFRRGIVTVFTMVTGDLGYQDAFGLSYEAIGDDQEITSNILYPETANFIWVVFLVLIPILLTNMLTGLAVGDIIELQKNATLTKLEQRVKMIARTERYFYYKLVKKCANKIFTTDRDEEFDERIISYNKKRNEEIKEIRAETSGEESKRHVRIMESIGHVKDLVLKKIAAFEDRHDVKR